LLQHGDGGFLEYIVTCNIFNHLNIRYQTRQINSWGVRVHTLSSSNHTSTNPFIYRSIHPLIYSYPVNMFNYPLYIIFSILLFCSLVSNQTLFTVYTNDLGLNNLIYRTLIYRTSNSSMLMATRIKYSQTKCSRCLIWI